MPNSTSLQTKQAIGETIIDFPSHAESAGVAPRVRGGVGQVPVQRASGARDGAEAAGQLDARPAHAALPAPALRHAPLGRRRLLGRQLGVGAAAELLEVLVLQRCKVSIMK